MNKENINCISHPFGFEVEEDPQGDSRSEGPFPIHDFYFSEDESVKVRNVEHYPWGQFDRFPNGGFTISKWLKTREDGTGKLTHYHIDVLPSFDTDTDVYLNERIKASTSLKEAKEKAQNLAYALPVIRICPDNMISLIAGGKHYFSFTEEGEVVKSLDRGREFFLLADRKFEKPVFRFASSVTEIIDTQSEDRYKVQAVGAIYLPNLNEIREILDLPVVTGTLNQDHLDGIARLDVSVIAR